MHHMHLELGGFWLFFPVYVLLVGVFAWRVVNEFRVQRAAEMMLREQLARRTARALAEMGPR
jgi:hypothetical protein